MKDEEKFELEIRIRSILRQIGDDPDREGLLETPTRVANMFTEIYKGYTDDPPGVTVFRNGHDGIRYNEMILDEGSFYSMCEHHMMPFFGNYWFAYIPSQAGSILGLSKVARVVDYFSAKLQVQERLTNEIVNYLWNKLAKKGPSPVGMALVMKGEHLCKTMRGAKKKGTMTTSVLKGAFKEQAEVRMELLNLISI